jgi:hypothetical protein
MGHNIYSNLAPRIFVKNKTFYMNCNDAVKYYAIQNKNQIRRNHQQIDRNELSVLRIREKQLNRKLKLVNNKYLVTRGSSTTSVEEAVPHLKRKQYQT